MYNQYNERSGLKAPLVADDVYEIIMKVFNYGLIYHARNLCLMNICEF